MGAFVRNPLCDPTDLDGDAESLAYKRMSAKENLPGFERNQKGFFSSQLYFTPRWRVPLFENMLKMVRIPTEQTGFPNVAGRPRERIDLYDMLLLELGHPPMVRRRSSVLYDLPIDPYLLKCESSFSQNYHVRVIEDIVSQHPLFGREISRKDNSLYDLMFMLLLPVCLEKARLQFLLQQAKRYVYVTQTGPRSFVAHVSSRDDGGYNQDRPGKCLHMDDVTALTAAVGGVVELGAYDSRGKWQEDELFVRSLKDDVLHLTLVDRSDFTNRKNSTSLRPSSLLGGAHEREMLATFRLAVMEFKLQETAIIDTITACGWKYFGNSLDLSRKESSVFTSCSKQLKPRRVRPLIKSSQLDRLKSGVGFFNQNLSTDQKDAVVMFVGDYIDCFIQTLVGGAGCGKTAVSDEVLLLLNRYHVEAVPGDALALLAVPSNLCATKAVERLISKGFPAAQLLHVVGEQASFNHNFGHPVVRVTDYVHNDSIQLIIGTVQVLPRIFLLKNVKRGLYQKSPLFVGVDEVCATTTGAVLAVLVAAGEPQRAVVAGDPCQLPPRSSSATRDNLNGGASLLEALRRRDRYFEEGVTYPTPIAPNGVFLRRNFRANSGLVNLSSISFYDRRMYADKMGGDSSLNRETTRLLRVFQVIPEFKDLMGPAIWFDRETPYERHPNLPTLRNVGEIRFAGRIARAMGDLIGDHHIAVIAPYKYQVEGLETELKGRKMMVGSADEFQGSEASIVVLTLVRSKLTVPPTKPSDSLGFLKCPKRTNSMLTRAKHLLIIVGSKAHFESAGYPWWNDIASKAEVVVV